MRDAAERDRDRQLGRVAHAWRRGHQQNGERECPQGGRDHRPASEPRVGLAQLEALTPSAYAMKYHAAASGRTPQSRNDDSAPSKASASNAPADKLSSRAPPITPRKFSTPARNLVSPARAPNQIGPVRVGLAPASWSSATRRRPTKGSLPRLT